MGREHRPQDVQHARNRLCGAPDPDGDLCRLAGCVTREILSNPPRRVSPAQRLVGPDAGRTDPLAGRLPPVPSDRPARRADVPRGGIHPPQPLFRERLLPLALHERGLRLARHDRGGRPHGIPGPPPGRHAGRGQRGRQGRCQPGKRAPLGGQHRRYGHPAEPRRGGEAHRRALQQRRLLRYGRRRAHPLLSANRDDRRVRVLPALHHRPPHRLPHPPRRIRHDLPRPRLRSGFHAGQPLRGPPRRRRTAPTGPSSSTTAKGRNTA